MGGPHIITLPIGPMVQVVSINYLPHIRPTNFFTMKVLAKRFGGHILCHVIAQESFRTSSTPTKKTIAYIFLFQNY